MVCFFFFSSQHTLNYDTELGMVCQAGHSETTSPTLIVLVSLKVAASQVPGILIMWPKLTFHPIWNTL